MRIGLLGRPRLLFTLLLLETALVWPVAATVRALLGGALDGRPRRDALLALDASAWAELLFVDRLQVATVIVPLLIALAAWAMWSAVLPAIWKSALADDERGALVAERTIRHAPGLLNLMLRGWLVRAGFLLPAALVAWALAIRAQAEPSFAAFAQLGLIGLGIGLPSWAIASIVIDAARLLHLDGVHRPIAHAIGRLRPRPLGYLALGLGYGAAWLLVLVLYVAVLPAAARTLAGLLIWRLLFVTTRLVLASGRLLAVGYAMRSDSKWVSSQNAR